MEDGSLCGLLTRPDIQSCKLTAFARFFPIFLDPFAPVCRICANPNLTCRSHVSTIIFCTYGSQERQKMIVLTWLRHVKFGLAQIRHTGAKGSRKIRKNLERAVSLHDCISGLVRRPQRDPS